MPLDAEMRAKVRALAQEMGEDPDEAEGMADEETAGVPRAKESPEARAATAAEPPKIFAYHLPYMRANEIRRSIGLPEDAPDGDLMSGEWLAKHSPTTGTTSAPADLPATE